MASSFGGKNERWWDTKARVNSGLSLEDIAVKYEHVKSRHPEHIEIDRGGILRQINSIMLEKHLAAVAWSNEQYASHNIGEVVKGSTANHGLLRAITGRASSYVSHQLGHAVNAIGKLISLAPVPVIYATAVGGLFALLVLAPLGYQNSARAEPPPEMKYRSSLPFVVMNYDPGRPTPTPAPIPSGMDYALSIGLPPEIAYQFSLIPVAGTNERALIDETKIVSGKYSDVFKNRPDINAGYIPNGSVSDESLAKYKDLDGDGVSNRVELAQATSPFNPCDKDPASPSKKYVIVLSGGQVGYNSRTNESPIESGPTLAYLMFRDLGIPDSDIYFFLQKRASAVAWESMSYSSLRSINLTVESKVRQILADALLVDNPVSGDIIFERIIKEWRAGTVIISDDLLTAFGPVQVDYLNQQVTKDNLRNVFGEIRGKVKPADEIYFLRVNHGTVDPIEGYSPPGRGSFGISNFGWGGSGILYHYDINEFLSGIRNCRTMDIQVSSYAGALGKDIDLDRSLQPNPLGGPTLFIGISDPYNNFWSNAGMPAFMYGQLKNNPNLSIQQLLDLVHIDGSVPQYTTTNSQGIYSQFFFSPKAR